MTTEHDDQAVTDAAADLKGTPYELLYIAHPTPTSTKYGFHHTTATAATEAQAVIAEALKRLSAGTAEWTSGIPYGANPGDVVPERWADLYPVGR
jgi:hypothetical protein